MKKFLKISAIVILSSLVLTNSGFVSTAQRFNSGDPYNPGLQFDYNNIKTMIQLEEQKIKNTDRIVPSYNYLYDYNIVDSVVDTVKVVGKLDGQDPEGVRGFQIPGGTPQIGVNPFIGDLVPVSVKVGSPESKELNFKVRLGRAVLKDDNIPMSVTINIYDLDKLYFAYADNDYNLVCHSVYRKPANLNEKWELWEQFYSLELFRTHYYVEEAN